MNKVIESPIGEKIIMNNNKLNVPNIIKLWGNVEGTGLFGIDYGNERIYQYSWNGGPAAHGTGAIDVVGKTGIHGDVIVSQNLNVSIKNINIPHIQDESLNLLKILHFDYELN